MGTKMAHKQSILASAQRVMLSWVGTCLAVALALTSDAKADALSDTVNCLEKSVVCVGGAAKTQLSVIKASGTVLEFAALHPNCVADFVELNPITVGVSTGMAALKVGGVPTDDAYGAGGSAIAGVLATAIPVPALQNIATSVAPEYAGKALQEIAFTIPVPSVAVPTVDAQIQCGQAIAKSGVKMVDDVKSVIGNAKSMVKSCGAAASCFADVLKSIVTNPIGALEGVGSALYSGAKKGFDAAGDLLSGQPPNIPAGEYFSKIWYQQLPFLAATYAIQGSNAGGAVMATMYSQCFNYYDKHRMSNSSATETCDQIRGWHSDASAQNSDPWPHKSLNQMIQDFINTNAANLVAESYKQASVASAASLASCPSGNATCAAKVKQIYKDAADGITPGPNATNDKKIALLMPCVAADKQSFDVPKCVAPAMATAKMQVDTYTKATKGWSTLFTYGDARATLNQMFDDWSAASSKTYLSQCNPGAAVAIGMSKCAKYIKNLLTDAGYENKKIDIGVQCNAGTKESPDFDLANCLKYTTSKFEPKLKSVVDTSDKEAADNALVLAKLALPDAIETYRAKGVANWKPQCKGLAQCIDTVTGAYANAALAAKTVPLANCQVDAYNYNFPKCLEAPFASAVMASAQAVNLQSALDQISFLAKYVTPYADKCQLAACKSQIAQLGNSWFAAVGGYPYQGTVSVGSDLKAVNPSNAVQMKPQSVKFIAQIEGEIKFTSNWYAKQVDPFLKQCQHDTCRSAVLELANKWFEVISNATPLLGQVSLSGSSAFVATNPADADYIKKLEDVVKKQSISRAAGDAQPNLNVRAAAQTGGNLVPTMPVAPIAPMAPIGLLAPGAPGAALPVAASPIKVAPAAVALTAPSTTPAAPAQVPVPTLPISPPVVRAVPLPMAGPDMARSLVAAGCVVNPPNAVPLGLAVGRAPATGASYSCANAAGFSLCEQAKTQPGSGVSACMQRGR